MAARKKKKTTRKTGKKKAPARKKRKYTKSTNGRKKKGKQGRYVAIYFREEDIGNAFRCLRDHFKGEIRLRSDDIKLT